MTGSWRTGQSTHRPHAGVGPSPVRTEPIAPVKLAVVIPAFNEARTIARVATAACAAGLPVIIVDDGSTDGTADRLRDLPVTLIRHAVNAGKGASLWDGMQRAIADGAQAVITMDGDGQHRADDLPLLVDAALRHPARLIIGARLQQRQQMPRLRRFGNAMADFWISWAAGWPITDTQSGFRLYPAAVIRHLERANRRAPGFVFESEVLIEATRAGVLPLAVPIDAIYHPGGRASHYRPILDTLLIIRMVAGKLLARGFYLRGLWRSLQPTRTAD